MSKSRNEKLLEKSIASSISAIEIYNKPDFKYREETFCILMINAWELLLKARLLAKNNNNLTELYIKEYYRDKKGNKKDSFKYRRNRSGNKMTIDLYSVLKRLKEEGDINNTCFSNIESLMEIRDNVIHFYSKDPGLSKKVLELGTATLRNYVLSITKWFDYDLSKYNFYLMPISFYHDFDFQSFSIKKRKKQIKKLLEYIRDQEDKLPLEGEDNYHISLRVNTELIKSSSISDDEVLPFRWTDNPNAPSVKVEEESIFARKYPLNYQEMVKKMRNKYKDFKQNQKFYRLKKKLEKQDEKYCKKRYLDYKNKVGSKRKYYSTEVFKEFDKHYTRK